MRYLILIILLQFLFSYSQGIMFSQSTKNVIQGKIIDKENNPIYGATVVLKETNSITISDEEGYFEFNDPYLVNITIEVSYVGFKKQLRKITPSTTNTPLIISLIEEATSLNDVLLVSKSKAEKIEETAFAVQSIDVKKLKNTTTDASVILNKTSGIRVRTAGGLGSTYKLSLNGLSDQQIRIFLDDIPIDELGNAYDLNNISVSLTERIDVYKGVVPVTLGADALGGAINIVTNKAKKSFLDVSHSAGSFNTHRSNLNAQYRSQNTGFTVKVNGSFNYSDNDYTMYGVPFFVNEKETFIDTKRFHDRYRSTLADVGIGYTGTNWADDFMFHFSTAQIDNEVQGTEDQPLGEVTEDEKNNTFRIRFKKKLELFKKELQVDWFALYNDLNRTLIDTSSNRYDWRGNLDGAPTTTGQGEFLRDKIFFKYNQTQFLSRINFQYALNAQHVLSVNHIYSNIERKGENRINVEEAQPFQSPNVLSKNVTGLQYTSRFFKNKLENTIGVKHYNLNILSKKSVQFKDQEISIEDLRTEQNNWGYFASARYFIIPDLFIKASFEKGYRLPQPNEIFGDGLLTLASPEILPETSENLNLGLNYRWNFRKGFLKNELNVFQRKAENFIRLKQLGIRNSYQNELNVLIRGVEWDFAVKVNKIGLSGNLSWQQVLNDVKYVAGTTEISNVYRQQLPNTPSLFGNAEINYEFPVLFKNINSSMYYGVNFVDEFFLSYGNIAKRNAKNIIPVQFLNNVGATFSTKNKRHNLSIEAQNIFNELAFDNIKQQKPGRAFFVKYRLFIEN